MKKMTQTIKAVVKEGKIELLEPVHITDGTPVWVTVLSDDSKFWLEVSEPSLKKIWDNEEDNVYEQLL